MDSLVVLVNKHIVSSQLSEHGAEAIQALFGGFAATFLCSGGTSLPTMSRSWTTRSSTLWFRLQSRPILMSSFSSCWLPKTWHRV